MATLSPPTILVVEDSDDDFFVTLRAFKKVALENPVQRCATGEQALDYLYRRGEFAGPDLAPRPGLILLDLNLPGTDGREVLRIIKGDPLLRPIPVVVLTTSVADQDVRRCYDDGANSYMRKPVDLQGFELSMTRFKEYWFEVSLLPGGGP